jgi:hypothetical protein
MARVSSLMRERHSSGSAQATGRRTTIPDEGVQGPHVRTAPLEVEPQRTGDDRQDHVVHGAAERVLDRLDLVEADAVEGDPSVGPGQRAVVGRARRGPQAGPRERPDADQRRADLLEHAPGAPQRRPHGAHELARRERALDERLAEQLDARGHAPGMPHPVAGGGLLLGGEQRAEDVQSRDPVDERVMGLREDREALAAAVLRGSQALDEPQLPQRLVTAQRAREQPAGEHAELVVAAGLGQRG